MQLLTPPLLPLPVFSSAVVLSVQLFQNNNEAVNYLIMSGFFSVGLTTQRLIRSPHNPYDGHGYIIFSLMGH